MIEGVKVIDVPKFEDKRGRLTQVYEKAEGLPDAKRIYIVKNWDKSTIRAFHKNFSEQKTFFVVSGAVKFQLVDDRPSSPTYRQQQKIVLTADKPVILVVPSEVHNGWKALTDDALLLCIADTTMADHHDERVKEDSFGVTW